MRRKTTPAIGRMLFSVASLILISCPFYIPSPSLPHHGLSSCFVETIAGSAGQRGSDDGTADSARFSGPGGITTDEESLFVADTGNHTIRRIVIATREVSTMAGSPGIAGVIDGNGSAARFNHPSGIATDGTNLYIADTGSSTIRKLVIASGDVTTIAGTAGDAGANDGIGSAARFDHPGGIATDGTYLYVADTRNSTIRRIVVLTGEVTTIAGEAGSVGSVDETGTAARFNWPSSITSRDGRLFVADTVNCTIRSIDISTTVTNTLTGSPGTTGISDGIGFSALFCNPGGITADGTRIFISDTSNGAIRSLEWSECDLSFTVITLAGVVGNYGSIDESGDQARFYWPFGIVESKSSLYVADSGNHTIRVVNGF